MGEYPLTEKVKSNSSANETERFYIYGPTGIIALVDNGSNYFVVKDHLGSVRVVLDRNSSPVSYYDYTVYGGKLSTTVNLDPHYQFTGQEFDTESGLFNFRARMYDSRLGIFYAMDPAGQNYSPFSYCGNNPVIRVDRDGKFWEIIAAIIGAYLGGASSNHWEMNPKKWDFKNPETYLGITMGGAGGWMLGGTLAAGNALTVNLTANWLSSTGHSILSAGLALSKVGTSSMYISGIGAGAYGINFLYHRMKDVSSETEEALHAFLDSPQGRAMVPDIVSFGVGFSAYAGPGTGTSFEFRWVTRGNEASFFPMVTATQSVGAGWMGDLTFNIEGAYYTGDLNKLTRKMIQTSIYDSKQGYSLPAVWGSGGLNAAAELGITGFGSKTFDGNYIIGGQINIGAGLTPLLKGGAGVSNTWILYDFWRKR